MSSQTEAVSCSLDRRTSRGKGEKGTWSHIKGGGGTDKGDFRSRFWILAEAGKQQNKTTNKQIKLFLYFNLAPLSPSWSVL